jgi:transposase
MDKIDFRALPPKAQEDIRRKAVTAVIDGKTQIEAAELFGITRQAVGNWIEMYQNGGEDALRAKVRGRRKGKTLKPWQAAQIAKTVIDKNPDQLKFPFYLWTREAVGKLIEKRFKVELSVWTVGRYLKDWGFTPQKPVKKAFEQNPEAVRAWLAEEYPAIRTRAKRTGAEIHWGDEMGLRSDHATGTTYGLRGKTPTIPGPGRRFGCQMISSITNRGRMSFMVFKEKFRVPVFIEFLRRLVRNAQIKIILIVDGHSVHRSAKVTKWVSERKNQIEIEYLPGYSPELNPDEYLNNDVKANAVGRRRARDAQELMSNIRCYLRSTQRLPIIVRRFFDEEHVRYAAM